MPKKERKLDTIRIGVEIECEFPNKVDSEKLIEKHRIIPGWEISGDGSLDNGAEYKMKDKKKLYFNKDGIEQLKEILGLLKAHKAIVTQRCGFHCHIDMSMFSDQEIVNMVYAFIKEQNTIYRKFKVLRHREKAHCNKIPKRTKITADMIHRIRAKEDIGNQCENGYLEDRDWGLNCDALDRHGSIEWRLYNGSIQINTIKRNIKFALEFCIKHAKGK
jgi:hypothetical protein